MESQQQGTEQENKACVLCGKEFPGTSEVCPDDGTLLTPIGKEPKIGDIFADKYEILGVLGDGGMGKVYKARHNLMKRVVALKMLLPHLVSSAAALKRFQQEAQAASALKHPHILTVHDFGISPKGMPYLVMDYLEGVSLSALLQDQGNLPQERCLNIFIQACSALSHAHKNGVVHRDLKPANLMLIDYDGTPDFVMIVDFGIAKLLLSEGAEQLTHTGEVFGSPLYMSPEQCRGKELDARSDIYSLGCVAYRTATGRPVFGGRDAMECMYKQVNDLPAPFSDVCPELGLSEKFEAAIFKAIAKDPAERYESMSDFRTALEEVRGGALPPAHKIFAVPPNSGQSVAYDAATDHLRKPNLGATQMSESAAAAAHEKSPTEIIGINEKAVEPTTQDVEALSNSASSAAVSNTMPPPVVPPVAPTAPAGTETASIHSSNSSQINLAHSTGSTAEYASPSGSNPAFGSNPSMSAPPPNQASAGQASSSSPAADSNNWVKIAIAVAVIVVGAVAFAMMKGGGTGKSPDKGSDVGTTTSTGITGAVSAPVQGLLSQTKAQIESGDYKTAEQTLKSASETAMGKNSDADLLDILPVQASVYEQAGKFPQAQEALAKLLEIQQKLNANAIDIARTKSALALPMLEQGDVASAEPLLNDALKTLSDAPEDEKRGLSHVYYGLSKIAVSRGDYNKATDYLQQAILRKSKVSGATDPDLVQFWQDLGEVYLVQGKLSDSEEALGKVLKIADMRFGKDSAQAADAYKDFATVYFQKGQLGKSEAFFKKALAIKSKDFGADSVSAAEVMAAMAMLYTREQKYKLAEPLFQQALEIRTRELGADSPQAKRTKELYATLQKRMKGSK